MSDANPVESEAILLRWRAQHPDAVEGELPTDEERQALLLEIRHRQKAIEESAIFMLMKATRNQPSRSGGNSKYMQFFWLVLVCVFTVGGVFWVIYSLLTQGRI